MIAEVDAHRGIVWKISWLGHRCVEVDGAAEGKSPTFAIVHAQRCSSGEEFSLRRRRRRGAQRMYGDGEAYVGDINGDVECVAHSDGHGDHGMRAHDFVVIVSGLKVVARSPVGGESPKVAEVEDDAAVDGGTPPAEGRGGCVLEIGGAQTAPKVTLRGEGFGTGRQADHKRCDDQGDREPARPESGSARMVVIHDLADVESTGWRRG